MCSLQSLRYLYERKSLQFILFALGHLIFSKFRKYLKNLNL